MVILFVGAGFRIAADCSSFGLPFTDLSTETGFCAAIAEAYFSGLTNGTTSTTFSPGNSVPREQMAAFITRTLDAGLLRGGRRASLRQFETGAPRWDLGFGLTPVGSGPLMLASDGTDIWVPDGSDGTVYRVRASDGSVIAHWTGATAAESVVLAFGRVFISGWTSPGKLYMIDPTAPPGAVTLVASVLNDHPYEMAFDGTKIWAATLGSVSTITPNSNALWPVGTASTGLSSPFGMLFDGSNIWVTDTDDNKLKKLDSLGAVLQSVDVGTMPGLPAFDGANIWVPNEVDNSVSVVRASTGAVLATLTGNGLSSPLSAAFDGQRILVANSAGGLSLFQATTLTAIGNYPTTGMSRPFAACSDGSNFWISDIGGQIGRF